MRVVCLCDVFNNKINNINLFSNDLEKTSAVYYNALVNAFRQLKLNVVFYESLDKFIDNINQHKKDIIMTAIWSGTDSRNRKILSPSVCEAYKLKYVGADSIVSALSQDKNLTKLYCSNFNIKIPKSILVEKMDDFIFLNSLSFPIIIKPNYEGSSIGISDNNYVTNPSQAYKLGEKLLKKFPQLIVEEYIEGEEISICIAGHNNHLIIEAVKLIIDGNSYFKNEIWGYESKKKNEKSIQRKVVTNSIDPLILEEAKKIYLSLGKVDYMRIDGRLYNNKFYLIEFTPDCSLHPDCFMSQAFYENKYSYEDMISYLLSLADY